MSPWSAAAVAVGLALVVYLPSLGNGFAHDDDGDIVGNTTVHGLDNTGEILTFPYRGAVPPWLRMTTAVANITDAARLLLFPADLIVNYGPDVILPAGIGALRFWVGISVLLVAGALAVSSLRRSPWTTLGIVWVVLSLSVVGNVVFPVGFWVAERTLYLPSVSLPLLAVGIGQYTLGFLRESAPRLRWSAVGAAMLLMILGGARTWTRTPSWYDTETVFVTLAEEHPESLRAQWWMGLRLMDTGEQDRGLEWLSQPVGLNPNGLHLQLYFVRGLLLVGRTKEAVALVSSLPPDDPSRDVYLTQSYIQLDQPDRAREAVQEGLARFPKDARLLRQARELGASPAESL